MVSIGWLLSALLAYSNTPSTLQLIEQLTGTMLTGIGPNNGLLKLTTDQYDVETAFVSLD
jgi:hypothetical protein